MTMRSGWNRLAIVDRFRDRAGLGDDLELISPIKQGDEALADDLVVVDHQERQRPGWAVGHGVSLSSLCFVGRSVDVEPCSSRIALDVHGRTNGRDTGAHVGESLVTQAPARRRIEPSPVVFDPQPEASVRLRADPDDRARCPRVARDVGQGLIDDAQQMRGRGRVWFGVHRSGMQLDIDHRVVAKLLDDGRETCQQRHPAEQLWPKAEDEVADVPDREVEAVDRALDASLDFVGVVAHELRDVLEREPDGIDVLDDAVVEVLADALALIDDRQSLDLLVQMGILDRDPGVDGKRLDEALVSLGELGGADLVGEIQVADRVGLSH